jgi:hypothetical protein
MKIRSASANNRKKAFEIRTSKRSFIFPYSKVSPKPSVADPVVSISVDKELASEGFTYLLKSGREGSIHIDQVLDYNEEPSYLRDALLYKLTLEAQKRVSSSLLSKREIVRRLGTSATQFYRLLDPANYRKSIDSLLSLLHVLDCDIDLRVRPKRSARRAV